MSTTRDGSATPAAPATAPAAPAENPRAGEASAAAPGRPASGVPPPGRPCRVGGGAGEGPHHPHSFGSNRGRLRQVRPSPAGRKLRGAPPAMPTLIGSPPNCAPHAPTASATSAATRKRCARRSAAERRRRLPPKSRGPPPVHCGANAPSCCAHRPPDRNRAETSERSDAAPATNSDDGVEVGPAVGREGREREKERETAEGRGPQGPLHHRERRPSRQPCTDYCATWNFLLRATCPIGRR